MKLSCLGPVACAFTLLLSARETPPKQTVMLPMRDGVRLGTDIYQPGSNGAFPVILSRTPYNKDALAAAGLEAARRGFAFIAQDTRGRFASEGENLPFHLDMHDGSDTVEWLSRQPWCNGKIGTWGGSAVAITQFQMVVSGTEHIDAQYLVVGAPNIYDVAYVGGVFRTSLVEGWLKTSKFATNALSIWVNHPTYDSYWRARDASRHYREANAPAVHIGGYWDIFTQATIDGFTGFQTHGGPKARGRQKLILGPWTHGVLQERAGEFKFPKGNKPPGNAQDPWAWFSYWLKGETNDLERTSAVSYYVVGDVFDNTAPGNLWRTADKWPPLKTHQARYYLSADRVLSTAKPAQDQPLEYTYDPANPAPTVGGIQLLLPAGPMDQKKVEERSDVLVFTTETLAEPVEVTGRVFARLWVSADVPDTDLMIKLCDVYPDGRSFNMCEGALRTRFRDGFEKEDLLKPGKLYPVQVDLWSTSVIFNRGHRIRVQVTSSSAPGYDPNPNTGHAFRTDGQMQTAHVKVHTGPRYPSHVVLPVVPPGKLVLN